MRGFLPPWIAIPLTEKYNNLIDFSFFGRTSFNKGIFSYTSQQITDRAYIWGAIFLGGAVAAFLDYTLRDESAPFSVALEIVLGAGLGGYMAHEQVMRPKINNRKRLIQECTDAKEHIIQKLQKLGIKTDLAQPLFAAILSITAKTEEQANATATLFKRKSAMDNLKTFVDDNQSEALDTFFNTPLQDQLREVTTLGQQNVSFGEKTTNMTH